MKPAGKSAVALGLAAFSLLSFPAAISQAGRNSSVPVRAEASLGRTLLGTDTQSWYNLKMTLSVYYDGATDEYTAEATASWKKTLSPFWAVAKSAEEFYEDSVIVTWEDAGESNLIAKANDFEGRYYGGMPITCRDSQGAPYGRYVLNFQEKTGYLGKELEQVKATVVLKKRETSQMDFAQVRMTYIHTYQSAGVNFSMGSKGLWAFFFPKAEKAQWQVENSVAFEFKV